MRSMQKRLRRVEVEVKCGENVSNGRWENFGTETDEV
jgi:hypothetical protein